MYLLAQATNDGFRFPLISDLIDIVDTVGPAVGVPMVMIFVGLVIGTWGHMAKSERTTAVGILMVFASSIVFLIGSYLLNESGTDCVTNAKEGGGDTGVLCD